MPVDKAATRGLPVYSQGAVPPGMRAQVVFLEQTPAKEMVAVLKPLMSPAGNIGRAAHNSLILVDNPENLEKLLRLIYLMDTRALADTMVRIVKVHNTDPREIITEMETIFSAYGTLAQKARKLRGQLPAGDPPQLRDDPGQFPALSRARPLLGEPIGCENRSAGQCPCLNVLNYKAKNLANLLTQVYGGAASAPTIKETKLGAAPAPLATSAIGGQGGAGGSHGGGMGGTGGRGRSGA